MSSCEDGLVICHYTGRRTLLKQEWNYNDGGNGYCWEGKKLKSEQRSEEGLRISLKCEPIDSYIAHIIQVRYSGFSSYSWRSEGTHPNCSHFDYSDNGGNDYPNQTGDFLILHATEDVTPILIPPLNTWAQRLAFTGTLPRSAFLPILGNIAGIKAWVAANQLTINESGEKDALNFDGKEKFTYTSFQGWEIDCIIPKPELDRYPFCGGHIIGEEQNGIVYRNLCADPFGICDEPEDCCNCCNTADLFLKTVRDGGFYLVGG